jgi:hypothetical protein
MTREILTSKKNKIPRPVTREILTWNKNKILRHVTRENFVLISSQDFSRHMWYFVLIPSHDFSRHMSWYFVRIPSYDFSRHMSWYFDFIPSQDFSRDRLRTRTKYRMWREKSSLGIRKNTTTCDESNPDLE